MVAVWRIPTHSASQRDIVNANPITARGEHLPWSIPALYSGLAGEAYANLGSISFLIVLLTTVAGLIATSAWWQIADQTD